MCTTPFEPCDVVVVLDVLHYVDLAAQDDVLARVRAALRTARAPAAARGRRVASRGASAASQWVDRVVTSVRGHRAPPTWGRTLTNGTPRCSASASPCTPLPMSQGTPFANVLLAANCRGAAR